MHNNLKENIHKELIKNIKRYGQVLPKKHGQWVRLQLIGEYSLRLDTYNGSITIQYITGEYNYHIGFSSKYNIHVGSMWGDFTTNFTLDQYFRLRSTVDKIIFKKTKWSGLNAN